MTDPFPNPHGPRTSDPFGDRPDGAPVRRIAGWVVLIVGLLTLVAGPLGGDGAGAVIGLMLIGLATAVVGAKLIWRRPAGRGTGVAAAVLALLGFVAVGVSTPNEAPSAAPGRTTPAALLDASSEASAPATETETETTSPPTTVTSTTSPPTTVTVTTTETAGPTETADEPETTAPRRAYAPRTRAPRTTAEPEYTPPVRAHGGSEYYANCSAARAAGAAPLTRGDPGYRPALDRDGDGVACE